MQDLTLSTLISTFSLFMGTIILPFGLFVVFKLFKKLLQ